MLEGLSLHNQEGSNNVPRSLVQGLSRDLSSSPVGGRAVTPFRTRRRHAAAHGSHCSGRDELPNQSLGSHKPVKANHLPY